ncbi:MAG: glutamine--tRNA ligase, partial [Clostridia bacterium]|nr:glutamine--tRNA ligase [Clostridia bacterium]
ASDCAPCEIRLYDRLFASENPFVDGKENYPKHLNPNSLEILSGCLVEGGIKDAKCGDTFQFMRQGYFCVDKASEPGKLVFNRTVALNSSWK